jgi:hypothetical protein
MHEFRVVYSECSFPDYASDSANPTSNTRHVGSRLLGPAPITRAGARGCRVKFAKFSFSDWKSDYRNLTRIQAELHSRLGCVAGLAGGPGAVLPAFAVWI